MFQGSKVRRERKVDNLTAIYEPIIYTMWDPQHLTTL
jgi:ABC-type cobalt transport system substrate-binding protein